MAPLNRTGIVAGAPPVADHRIQAVIDVATKLQAILRDRSAVPLSLRDDLHTQINRLPALNRTSLAPRMGAIDGLGAALWNATTPLLDDPPSLAFSSDSTSDVLDIGVCIRVFALLLLDAAHRASVPRASDKNYHIRLMKAALNGAKSCLQANDLELAHICLQTCSQYVNDDNAEPLMQVAPVGTSMADDPVAALKVLTSKYYLLRLLLAWKSDRLDLAEHFYFKFCKTDEAHGAQLVAEAADALYELADSIAKQQRIESAVTWYDRALAVFNSTEIAALSQEVIELILSITVAISDCLQAFDSSTVRQRTWQIIRSIDQSRVVSNRVAVPLVMFRLLTSETPVDERYISQTILRIVKQVVLSQDGFKLVLQTIKKASDVSVIPALDALKFFICERILAEIACEGPAGGQVQSWLENAAISYVMYATTRLPYAVGDRVDDLNELLHRIATVPGTQFTTTASHALQTLFWRASDVADSIERHAWIDLLQHPFFKEVGIIDEARVCRKRMRIALEDGNVAAALEAFNRLPQAAQDEPLTRFLAFKLALRTDNNKMAIDSLRVVSDSSIKDSTLLYACVLEAQQSNSRPLAIAALQAILDERPPGIHLPSLLRCTARLFIDDSDNPSRDPGKWLISVLQIIETAAKCIDNIAQASGHRWRDEIQWWGKTSYNLAVRVAASVEPGLLVRLIDACRLFLDRYPHDDALQQREQLESRKLVCAFLAASGLIVLGRCTHESSDEDRVRFFLAAQERIDVFNAVWRGYRGVPDEHMTSRAFTMRKYELECSLWLEKWDRLGPILQDCLEFRGVARWDTLADLVIILHKQLDHATQNAHADLMTQILQQAINDTWKNDRCIAKVARWLRFTFVLCLGHTADSQGRTFSFKLLEQAAAMAEHGERGKHERYPAAELAWLATTSFNHAIDLLIDEKQAAAVLWMDGALALARWADDSGALHARFTHKKALAMERVRGE